MRANPDETFDFHITITRSTIPGSVFVGPLDDADSSGAALILFLYRVIPNANLRNRTRRLRSFNKRFLLIQETRTHLAISSKRTC